MTVFSRSDSPATEVRRTLAWMVLSCLLFALVMVSVKLFLTDLPPVQTVFLRYVFGILLLMPLVAGTLGGFSVSASWKMLVVRAVCHALAVLFWFYSIMRIPLAEVNALLNLGPVYATIGAAIYFGEGLKLRRVMAILISFAGAMVIIKPGFAEINLGTIAVMLTAPLFAVSDLIAKSLKAHHDDNVIIIALSAGIAVATAVPAAFVWQPMSMMNWVGIAAIGTAATLGHVTLMKSFKGPMWAAQTGKYVQLLFVVLFGITLFDEIPVMSTIIGALVVLGAVSYIAVREGRARQARIG
jgi:drug/metabolite transporter (DMT)-like permease